MKRVLRWTGVALLALVILAVALWAIAFAVNSKDEELSPQARALLTLPPLPYRPDENLYVAFAGFDAPPGGSVTAYGQAKIDYYHENLEAALRAPTEMRYFYIVREDPRHLTFKGDVKFVHPANASVWDEVPAHAREIAALLADNRELYRRYLSLPGLRGYYETARPSILAPVYTVPNPLRKLFLAAEALRLRAGAAPGRGGLDELEADVRLWRTVLTGEGTLISKMIALAGLQADYLLFADMIADPQATVPLADQDADAVAPPFEPKTWNIGPVFAAEFRLASTVFNQTDATWGQRDRGPLRPLSNWVAARFFKLNATENLLARQTERQIAAAADPTLFRSTRDQPGVWLPEGPSVWLFPFSYNPFGKTLVAVATPLGDDYVLRAWDGAALQRAVRLGYEIRRRRIGAPDIPGFMAQHPNWSTHPADGHAFSWDPAHLEIRVQPLSRQQQDRRFSIHVWQPPGHP